MEQPIDEYAVLVKKTYEFAATLGLSIHESTTLDPYYKGDMDGKNIWISTGLTEQEELFNLLHMMGHCIQWNTSEEQMKLGCVLHMHPDDELLKKLQEYEWEANCYAYTILVKIGGGDLADWLYTNYRNDMLYLTNFYLTGEKVKEITPLALAHSYVHPFSFKTIPTFVPKAIEGTRNGIVIDFNKN